MSAQVPNTCIPLSLLRGACFVPSSTIAHQAEFQMPVDLFQGRQENARGIGQSYAVHAQKTSPGGSYHRGWDRAFLEQATV